MVQYISRSKVKTKHDGFFINAGKIETACGSRGSGGLPDDGDLVGAEADNRSSRGTNSTDDFKPKRKIKKKKKTRQASTASGAAQAQALPGK